MACYDQKQPNTQYIWRRGICDAILSDAADIDASLGVGLGSIDRF